MIWLLALLIHGASATVLLQGGSTGAIEYRAMLRAHPDYVSPTQQYLSSHPTSAHREKLLANFSAAQKAFLEGTNAEATQRLSEVLTLLHEDDWARSDREIFLLVYYRLAQLESQPEARDRWLQDSLLLGTDLKVDATLIPPPLILRRLELSAKAATPPSAPFAADWREVLVNGQSCPQRDCSTLLRYPGRVRVTLLSDRWLPYSQVVSTDELIRLQPETVAWAEGGCEHPVVHSEAQGFSSYKVFWSLACEAPHASAPQLAPSAPAPTDIPRLAVEDKRGSVFESKWFWGGVGAAVIAAVIIKNSQHHSETHEPTTTYGFK